MQTHFKSCGASVTLPRRFYLVIVIIPCWAQVAQLVPNYISVRFDDAIDGADADTLGRIVMPLAFHAGGLIDHVGDAIAFADRLGGALRYARATGDAVFSNFHGHGRYSFKMYDYAHKINRCPKLRQLTNFFYLVKFVTIQICRYQRVNWHD
jgi:hypothetical protein